MALSPQKFGQNKETAGGTQNKGISFLLNGLRAFLFLGPYRNYSEEEPHLNSRDITTDAPSHSNSKYVYIYFPTTWSLKWLSKINSGPNRFASVEEYRPAD